MKSVDDVWTVEVVRACDISFVGLKNVAPKAVGRSKVCESKCITVH